jgi:uncharacterized protein YkwD
MAMKRVLVPLLAVAMAATALICDFMLTPQQASATMATVKTCSGDAIQLSTAEKRVFELQNKARARHGLKALCVHPALTKAARAHSKEMIEKDYFSHDSFNGETVGQRLKRFGYTYSGYSYYLIGENIGSRCGSGHTPYDMFKWWMSSPDHRASILNKDFRQVGIGIHRGTFKSCTRATMYTVDFGARRR